MPFDLAAHRRHRIEHRLCVRCGAPLEVRDGRLCQAHALAAVDAATRYKSTAAGRKVDRASHKRRYWLAANARRCVVGGCTELAAPNRRRCTGHAHKLKLAAIARAERTEST